VHKSIIKGHKRIGTIPGMIGTIFRIGWNETPDSLAKVAGISNLLGCSDQVLVRAAHSFRAGITVLKFKRRITHLLINPAVIETLPSFEGSLTGKSDRTPADELEEIAEQQEKRIKRIIKEEQETGIKYPFLNREFQGLAALRKAIIKQREYEQKHGAEIKARKDKEMEKVIKKKFDKLLPKIGDGERLISAMNRFLEMATKEAVIMEEDPDRK
jgi:hypothetical protein